MLGFIYRMLHGVASLLSPNVYVYQSVCLFRYAKIVHINA